MDRQKLSKLEKYCAYQERCHYEVEKKGRELGLYGLELDEILVELIKNNFLNEERYVELFVRSKINQKYWGPIKLEQELRFKKISDKLIGKYIHKTDAQLINENCRKLLLKYTSERNLSLKIGKNRNKTIKYLMNKGYNFAIISEEIAKLQE